MERKNTTKNRVTLSDLLTQSLDAHIATLKSHRTLILAYINDLMENQARSFSEKPKGAKRVKLRYGTNPSTVRIGAEKLRVLVPRLKDVETGKVENAPIHAQIKTVIEPDEEILTRIMAGVSTRDYRAVAGALNESVGLSKSTVDRHFIEAAQKAVKVFEERRFDELEFAALFIDGKRMGGEQVVIAMGVTTDGVKIVLGYSQMTGENTVSVSNLLRNLIERGFRHTGALLCVLDGSKGLRKAVVETFGDSVVIQRCVWHKRENVLSHLSEKNREIFKPKLNDAWNCEDFAEAKKRLRAIGEELKPINLSAARSLEEGLDETLTLQNLGIKGELKRSFSTSNCIESLNSLVDKYLKNVKRWRNSDQIYRWSGAALIEAEKRLGRVRNHTQLPLLTQTIRNFIVANQTAKNSAPAEKIN